METIIKYHANKTNDKVKQEYCRGCVNAAAFACTLAKVPNGIVYDIQVNGLISGLENLAKFSSIVLYESDYKF